MTSANERARRGCREVRLQLRPRTAAAAAAVEARAAAPGRQAVSDAVNGILAEFEDGSTSR